MGRSRNNLYAGSARLILWVFPGAVALLPLGALFLSVGEWTQNPILSELGLAVFDTCLAVVKFFVRLLAYISLCFTVLSLVVVAVAAVSHRLGWGPRGNVRTISLDRFEHEDSPEARKEFDQMYPSDDFDPGPQTFARLRGGDRRPSPPLPTRPDTNSL